MKLHVIKSPCCCWCAGQTRQCPVHNYIIYSSAVKVSWLWYGSSCTVRPPALKEKTWGITQDQDVLLANDGGLILYQIKKKKMALPGLSLVCNLSNAENTKWSPSLVFIIDVHGHMTLFGVELTLCVCMYDNNFFINDFNLLLNLVFVVVHFL